MKKFQGSCQAILRLKIDSFSHSDPVFFWGGEGGQNRIMEIFAPAFLK